jgi:hypothetical protein
MSQVLNPRPAVAIKIAPTLSSTKKNMGNYTGKKPAKWELYKQDNDDSSMDLYMSNYAGSRQTPSVVQINGEVAGLQETE